MEKQDSSAESHYETEDRASSPSAAPVSGLDCDLDSDFPQSSAPSSLQSSATSLDISSPISVREEAMTPSPSDIVPGALADSK